jgi:hypothetical protein
MKFLGSDGVSRRTRTPHYRFFQALYLAFFSRKLYVDVARRWRGLGVGYLCFMLSIFVLPYAVQTMLDFKHHMDVDMILPMKLLPSFEVRGGEAFFHQKMPYLVKNEQGDVISIIDTDGSINALPSTTYPKAKVLVTRNTIRILMSDRSTLFQPKTSHEEVQNIYSLRDEDDMFFSGADVIKKVMPMSSLYMMMFSFYPMVLMFCMSFYIIVLFSFVFVGQMLARLFFKVPLSFKEVSRVLVVSATPQACIYFSLLSFDKVYPGMRLMYAALLAAYFSFAVLSLRSSSKAMVSQ